MKTIKSILILILVIAAIFGLYKLADFINGEIPEPTIETKIEYVEKKVTDTTKYAEFRSIIDSLGNLKQEIIIIKEPYKVTQIDKVFEFSQINTYRDSVRDTFISFVWETDVIGQILDFRYTLESNYPIITKTITTTKEFNSVSVNGSFGNSVQISAGYIPKGKNIQYSVAYDPIRKVYLVGCGYVFKF